MKKTTLMIGVLLSATGWYAQQDPTANQGGGRNNEHYWSREGNTAANGANNIFGTRFNSPIYTWTDHSYRMKLNGSFINSNQYPINGYTFGNTAVGVNTTGYLLLGHSKSLTPGGPSIYRDQGAFSLLHLNGRRGQFIQTFGYRPWMETGITFTDNQDLSYFGLRSIDGQIDKTETVLAWSDNATGGVGPDDLTLRFTSGGQGNTNYSNNYDDIDDIDGLHVARFTGTGMFALGPVFGVTTTGSPTYYMPQSIQHIGEDRYDNAYLQVTNTLGTGMTQNDGLRLGIEGNAANGTNGVLKWQENNSFIIRTDWNNNPGGINNGERLRITTIGDNQNAIPQPGSIIDNNTTRVAISYRGSNPVTEPRSLLHLGFNAGLLNGQHGWRNWMDFGTFTTNGQDHVYVGLKEEPGGGVFGISERMDAVIAWGDEESANNNWGPDNMRFIFTEPTGGNIAGGQDGLEIARMTPESDGNSNGMLGVGDFTNANVTHKLHVQGNGRFEFVPTDNTAEYIVLGKEESSADDISLRKLAFTGDPADVLLGDGTWGTVNPTGGTDDQIITNFNFDNLTNVLTIEIEDGNTAAVDLTDLLGTDDQNLTNAYLTGNDLTIEIENGSSVTVDLSDLNLVTADNGLTINPVNNNVQWGQVNTGAGTLAGGELIHDTEIPMNGNNLYFPGGGTLGQDRLSIGNPLLNLDTKVVIWNDVEQYGILSVSNSNHPNQSIGVQGTALGSANSNVGVRGIANMASGNYHTGLRGLAAEGAIWNMAADLDIPATSTMQNYGYHVQVIGTSNGINTGGEIRVQSTNSGSNFGLNVSCYDGANNYGVYSSVLGTSGTNPPSGPNYAGYFNGDVYISGSYGPSDVNMKTNVQDYDSSLYVISLLEPKTFEYTDANYQGMSLPNGHQYGLIAQEVEQVLPNIVSDNVHPAQYDTTGAMIYPEYQFKGVDYQALIPILLGGVKEQQEIIDSQDSMINDLNARLSTLESCLSNILPFLCQVNSSAIMQNDEQTQNAIVNQLEVILKDETSIVLEQNVPNPFAEQTVINYYIPESVQRAQIHFYNLEGQLINTVEINELGNGQLKVFGSDLSSGTYTYTLVADGQVITTKKMVKTN